MRDIVVVPGRNKSLSQVDHLLVELGLVRIGVCVCEVEVGHGFDTKHVKVGVSDLESCDHQPNSSGSEQCFLRVSDVMSARHAMRRILNRKVGPLVGFRPWNHEAMPWSQGANIEKSHASHVLPYHSRRNIAVDNLGEDRTHSDTVGAIGAAAIDNEDDCR